MGLPTGPKWEAIGGRYETLAPSKKGGMFVDCSGLSARRLAPLPFNWKMVHTPATPLRLKAVDAPLPQTNQSSLDPIRKSYLAIPSGQIQARMDKLAAYRDAVKKLKMPPLLKTVNDAIKTLNTARDQA